jgi:hypothetical protein
MSVFFHEHGFHTYSLQAIHSDAAPLEAAINKATTDSQASAAFSEADGSTILNAVEALQPQIISALTNLDAQHAKFAALPIGGIIALVEADLKTLSTDTTNFENALTAKAPVRASMLFPVRLETNEQLQTDLQPAASSIISAVGAAFQTAIATYAS